MCNLDDHYLEMLKTHLKAEFVPVIPPLLDQSRSQDEQALKNLSRSFSAFAIHHIAQAEKATAGQAVVDDFDDYGIDAIYYQASSETLYLIQSK